jgi:hypothetical protein
LQRPPDFVIREVVLDPQGKLVASSQLFMRPMPIGKLAKLSRSCAKAVVLLKSSQTINYILTSTIFAYSRKRSQDTRIHS